MVPVKPREYTQGLFGNALNALQQLSEARKDLEAIRKIWLEWRENGVAKSLNSAHLNMVAIGKIVEPDYPTDRLRAPEET